MCCERPLRVPPVFADEIIANPKKQVNGDGRKQVLFLGDAMHLIKCFYYGQAVPANPALEGTCYNSTL